MQKRDVNLMRYKTNQLNEIRSSLVADAINDLESKDGDEEKLGARKRIERLVDKETFNELELFSKPIETGIETNRKSMRGDGVITGFGKINGRPVCIWSQNCKVAEGKAGIIHLRKIVTLMERAIKSRIPIIGIFDSTGIRAEDFITTPTDYPFEKLLYFQSLASGVIPQISVIMGPCRGVAAISSQLTDFVFIVSDTGQFSATNKVLGNESDETRKSNEIATTSGCCDFIFKNDKECLDNVKLLLTYLPANNNEKPPLIQTNDTPDRELHDLLDLVPAESKKPFNMHEAIRIIVDDREFIELKSSWAKNIIIGFGSLDGTVTGILANNPLVMAGCLDVNAADKMTRFVNFCDAFNIPLTYLADTPAFLPSIEQEQKGIIRHGAKIVFSNSVATVPQVQIYMRKCYGGGNLAMPGNALGGDFGITWPTTELLLMAPEGAVSIVFRKEIESSDDPKAQFQFYLDQFKGQNSTENIWEYIITQDNIDPTNTRKALVKAHDFLRSKNVELPTKRNDNMPL